MNKEDKFLKAITVKTETINLESADLEVTIKEHSLDTDRAIEEIRQKHLKGLATFEELVFESCKHAMIDPVFPNEEDLKNLTSKGMQILTEIYMRIPEIGMSESEKEDYRKRLVETVKNQIKTLSDEELKKKPSKKKDSSLS